MKRFMIPVVVLLFCAAAFAQETPVAKAPPAMPNLGVPVEAPAAPCANCPMMQHHMQGQITQKHMQHSAMQGQGMMQHQCKQECGMMQSEGSCMGCKMMGLPDLTEEQKTKIEELHLAHAKAVKPLHNEVAEKMAKLNTLTSADNVDMKAVNSLIEEIGKIKTNLMKEMESHRQSVRKLLDEKQRLMFDKRHGGNGCSGHGCGMGMFSFRPDAISDPIYS